MLFSTPLPGAIWGSCHQFQSTWYRSNMRSRYQSLRASARGANKGAGMSRTKNSEIPVILLKSARAKPDLERLRTRYYYSGSHAPVPTSIERVMSVLRAGKKKGKTMRRRTWHRDLPGGTRTTRTDRRTNGWSPKKLSPLYQMEVYRDTGDFSRYQDIRQVSRKLKPERENEGEREENGSVHSLLLACTMAAIALTRSHSCFSWFSPVSPPTLASTWGEWEVSVNDFAGAWPEWPRICHGSDRRSCLFPWEKCTILLTTVRWNWWLALEQADWVIALRFFKSRYISGHEWAKDSQSGFIGYMRAEISSTCCIPPCEAIIWSYHMKIIVETSI